VAVDGFAAISRYSCTMRFVSENIYICSHVLMFVGILVKIGAEYEIKYMLEGGVIFYFIAGVTTMSCFFRLTVDGILCTGTSPE